MLSQVDTEKENGPLSSIRAITTEAKGNFEDASLTTAAEEEKVLVKKVDRK